MKQPIIRINGLSHRYTTSWAVSDINIEMYKTGIYGLLGSNGAGKSTTMNILSGVLKQTKGEVFIDGINLQAHPIEAKKLIGFLPQVPPLYMDLTPHEYLLYCGRIRGMQENTLQTSARVVMEKCGIVHMKDRLIKNLSGGYRQRVGIAQAIIHQPKLVILDEPTNGLDPVQIIEVRNLIKEIAVDHTVVFSSHILGEVQVLCQDILMIEQGKLIFSDTIDAFNNQIAPKSILLEFENPPLQTLLATFKGVSRVEQLTAKSFRLFYDGNKTVSENIIQSSVQNGWRLVQLAIEKDSIDEIFKQLTQSTSKN